MSQNGNGRKDIPRKRKKTMYKLWLDNEEEEIPRSSSYNYLVCLFS